MKCSNCQSENPEATKFCGGCGQKLILPSRPIPKELSFDEKLAKIQRYLPDGLTKKILDQKDRFEGECRQVTIMFCDMKGFTPLTHKLGPEETFVFMEKVIWRLMTGYGKADGVFEMDTLRPKLDALPYKEPKIKGVVGYVKLQSGVIEYKASDSVSSREDFLNAVQASCSLPVYMQSQRIGADNYVDGGISETSCHSKSWSTPP